MRTILASLCILICVFGIISYYFLSAPTTFVSSTMIHVSANESVAEVSQVLKDDGVVRYTWLLRGFIRFFKSDKQIARGDYLFEKGLPVYRIAWQLASSHHNVAPLKITLREGVTNDQIIATLSAQLIHFDANVFKSDARVRQGYLFPDTYSFFPLTTTSEVIDTLSSDFNKRIASITAEIDASGKTESDSIIMASLIQKEAAGKDDAPIISGILWRRISLGMPLQVDAAPVTYSQKGLPPAPINNPGLIAIKAAIHPEDSPYLFYLHDKNGMVHYATTFAEHKANIKKYL